MKKSLIFGLVSIIFFASLVSAASINISALTSGNFSINQLPPGISIDQVLTLFGNITCQEIKPFTAGVIGTEIPSKLPYKNEKFDLYVNNNFMGKIVIQNGNVTDFSCSNQQDRTYDIYVRDFSVLLSFSNGFDVNTFKQKLNSGEIVVKGVGFGKKIKWFFSKLALKWFM